MRPELFEIPFLHITVKSYGMMMVIGILVAIYVIRKLADRVGAGTLNKDYITNGALYALIIGVIGARLFYVLHHYDQFRGRDFISYFAIWEGGLELLGGAIPAIIIVFIYLIKLKLPIRRYLDILTIGLLITLGFGRLGCLMNGCCYGQPSNVPWAITFPYASIAYYSQAYPDPKRDRSAPQIKLPVEFYGFAVDGRWVQAEPNSKYVSDLKPYQMLTPEEKQAVATGKYKCLAVHPTQIYASLTGFLISAILFAYWRFVGYGKDGRIPRFSIGKPGCTFALMFMLYAPLRFLEETLRDDNPFDQIFGMTVSQLIACALFAFGVVMFVIFWKIPADRIMREPALSSAKQAQLSPHKARRSAR